MTAIDLVPTTYTRGLGSTVATATRVTAETVVCEACGCRLTTRESADDAGYTGARTWFHFEGLHRPRRPRLCRHLRRRRPHDRLTGRPAGAAPRRILATPRPPAGALSVSTARGHRQPGRRPTPPPGADVSAAGSRLARDAFTVDRLPVDRACPAIADRPDQRVAHQHGREQGQDRDLVGAVAQGVEEEEDRQAVQDLADDLRTLADEAVQAEELADPGRRR